MWWLKGPPRRQCSMSNIFKMIKRRQIFACCLVLLIGSDVIASISAVQTKSGNGLLQAINNNEFDSKWDGLSEKEKVVATYQLNNHQLVNYPSQRSSDLVNDDSDKLINANEPIGDTDHKSSFVSSVSNSNQVAVDDETTSVQSGFSPRQSHYYYTSEEDDDGVDKHRLRHVVHQSDTSASASRENIQLNSNDNLLHHHRPHRNNKPNGRQLNKQVQSNTNINNKSSQVVGEKVKLVDIKTATTEAHHSHNLQSLRSKRSTRLDIENNNSNNIAMTNTKNNQIPKKINYNNSTLLHSSNSSSRSSRISNSLFNHSENFISHKDAILNNQSNIPIDLFSEMNEIQFDGQSDLDKNKIRRKKQGYYDRLPNGVIVHRTYDCYPLTAPLTAPPRSRLTTKRPSLPSAGWNMRKGI